MKQELTTGVDAGSVVPKVRFLTAKLAKSWKRFHAPGSVEGWILVEADNANACYEHAAEWAECLNWEVTPVLTDEEAGPLMAKAYN